MNDIHIDLNHFNTITSDGSKYIITTLYIYIYIYKCMCVYISFMFNFYIPKQSSN
jgi:hypothetical protein